MIRDRPDKARRRRDRNGPRVVPIHSGASASQGAAIGGKTRFQEADQTIPAEIVILAGGLSKRMGRDKAGLRLGGRTLLAHVKAVAGRMNLPTRVIRRDLVERCGPLGGIHAALKSTTAEVVVFLSCDMPFVGVRLLRDLLSRSERRALAVFCVTAEGVGFPFALRRMALPAVEAQLEARQLSLQRLAARLGADRFRPPPSADLFNVNTPEEWAVARERWRASRSLNES